MFLLALSSPSLAATLEVGTAYATIAAAVSAAVDGDSIHVPAGTWPESVNITGKAITLYGDGAGVTIISPGTKNDVVTMSTRRAATLRDLTLAPAGGRGIAVTDGQLAVSAVTIDGGGASTSRGGGIYVDGGDLDLEDVVITASTAAYGAHVYATGGASVVATGLSLTGGTATYGGGLYADDGSTLDLADVVASAPYATSHGGFAYLDGADLVATNIVVDAPSGKNGYGAGFYLTGHASAVIDSATVRDASITGASSGYGGGAFYVRDGSSLALSTSTLSDGSAYSGAGIALVEASSATLASVRFDDNTSLSGGGAIALADGSTVDLDDCAFDGNQGAQGGAVYLGERTTLLDADGTYVDNESDDDGGAIYAASSAESTFDNASFTANTAGGDGGAILADGGLELDTCSLSSNLARTGDGGALAGSGDFTLADTDFADNTSSLGNGGAVAAEGSLSVENGRFTGNEAGDDGGAIRAEGSAYLWELALFDNVAGAYGGGLAIDGATSLVVARSYLHGNSAKNGGAASVNDASGGTLSNLRVTDNTASSDGGGLYLSGSAEIEVVNNTLAGNDAARNGGHLYTTAPLSLVNNIFYQAVDGGGAYGTSATTDRYYNLAYDNAGGDWVGWADPTGSSGNLGVDPMLEAYTADGSRSDDNLFLQAGSPAIDAGHPAIFDIDGSVSDIGAFGGPDADVADDDGDGFYDNVDCDDDDPLVNPSESDSPYDGIDNDCDGSDLVDVDGDGYAASVAGGTDCDDEDSDIKPGAEETWYDGVDQDCDGGSDYDQDGDHHDADFVDGGTDCDDLDVTIHGAAQERWYDGIDQDCDDRDDYDRDKDGYVSADYGGDDCDDFNADR